MFTRDVVTPTISPTLLGKAGGVFSSSFSSFYSFSSFAFFSSTKGTLVLRSVTLGDALISFVMSKVYDGFALSLKDVTREEEETKEDSNDDKVTVVTLTK